MSVFLKNAPELNRWSLIASFGTTVCILGAVQTLRNASKGEGGAKSDSPILSVLKNWSKSVT